MKFGSQFQWFLQYQLDEDYRSHCLQYRQLKKQLSACRKRDPSSPLRPDASPSIWSESYKPVRACCDLCDFSFWKSVCKKVKDIDAFFKKRATFVLQEHGVSPMYEVQKKSVFCFASRKQRVQAQVLDAELARESRQLIQFAQANTMALRKLMKKYDKVHGSGAGNEFLRFQMRKDNGNSFLKERSLLHELTALHFSLSEDTDCIFEVDKTHAQNCAELLQAVCLTPRDTEPEEHLPGPYALDLNCSVCLEVFMEPMALKCGHVFCKTCACRSARIHPLNPKGLKVASKTARCPMCREADVFQRAVPLPEVGELVKHRFPEQWCDRQVREQQMLPYKSNCRLDGYIQPSCQTAVQDPRPDAISVDFSQLV